MNGHSTAETLAFLLKDAARRCAGLVGDADDAPVVIFSAGPGSGEELVQQRLSRPFVTESVLDGALIGALASQLVRVASGTSRQVPSETDIVGTADRTNSEPAYTIARAQASFLRALSGPVRDEQSRWGLICTSLTGDYAWYFRILFPRAKIVFLHRHPLDTFRDLLVLARSGARHVERGVNLAAWFGERWCTLVASFELWHEEVGGLMVAYDRVSGAAPREIEQYLGESLSTDAATSNDGTGLQPDEVETIIERVAEIAERCGYRLASESAAPQGHDAGADVVTSGSAVHSEKRRVNCAILVPAMRYIEPECEDALRELERRGYVVRRVRGASPVDHARSRLATSALDRGFDETVWIDADTEFDPDSIDRLRCHELPIVAGLYARRHPRAGLAMAPVPGTREMILGDGGGLVEVLYAGTGFLLVRREVYESIKQRFKLPVCDENTSRRCIPFFMPMLEDWGGQLSYLGEDYAFSRRARLCGFKIMADTSIRLWHIGMYRYGYEDADQEVARVATYRHVFQPRDARGG